MKTSYYLVTATVVAVAAAAVYAQLPPPSAPPLPQVTLPPVSVTPEVPKPSLPVAPAWQPAPVAPAPKPVKPATTVVPPATIPSIPAPSLPAIPTPSVTPPALPAPPALPPVVVTPPAATIPPPTLPSITVPAVTSPVVAAPRPVVKPTPLPPPAEIMPPVTQAPPVVKLITPPPAALPAPTPVTEKPTGPAKYLVTADGKLVEGLITKSATGYVVRRGSLDMPYAKDTVLFVGHTKDEVYQHLLGRLDAKDVEKRVKLAQWCAFNGMRSQGLTEAKAIAALQPTNATAATLVRSLEASLKQFPEEGAPAAPAAPTPPPIPAAASEPEIDVTPDGAMAFASKAHTLLVNLCADCHAKPTYPGTFKMARSSSYDTTAATVRQNLRVVAAHLKKEDVATSPLLTKAVAPHGGLKEPPISSRQAAAFRNLEAWAAVAVGTDVLLTRPTPPAVVPVVPVAAPTPPAALPTASPFGAEAKPDPRPTAPSPTNPGNPVDEFDPSVFNKATRPK